MSASFGPKNGNPPPRNAETLKTIVCQTAPLAKLTPGGLKFGVMHFIYQINRLTTTKVDSTYLG